MCKCLRVCVCVCACECVGGCVYDCIGSQAQCTMYVVGSLKPGHPSNFVGLGGALFGASTSLYCGAGVVEWAAPLTRLVDIDTHWENAHTGYYCSRKFDRRDHCGSSLILLALCVLCVLAVEARELYGSHV